MADTLKKTVSNETRFTFVFDNAPTIKELLDTLKAVATADRGAVMKRAVGANNADVKLPVRFVFSMSAETDTDIPIV